MRSKGHQVMIHFFDNATIATGVAGKLKAGINAIYNRASAAEIRNVINNFKPDIVHVHNFFFAASPSVLMQVHKLGIPLVVTIQNYRLICANALLLRNNQVCELCIKHDFPWYGVKYNCYHDSAVQSAAVGSMAALHKWLGTWKNTVDLYITPSAFARNKLLESSFKVAPQKIQVKHNFIPDAGTGDINNRKNYFLFVGRLSSEKGVDVLIDAWSRLPNQQLIIAGDGPERERLMAKSSSLNNIQFIGRKKPEEIIELMKSCKALIFPSIWYEGLPLTIIEAFSTGTPVIGSDIGAISEMISHSFNGLLFKLADSMSLATTIEQYNTIMSAGDHSLYSNARTTYLEKYHPDKCYSDIMDLYDRLLKVKNEKY
jgi:glycosyltransferase involved in cell wall biosynthesis